MIAALALTIHVVVDNKYFGHFLVIVYYIASIMAEGFGYDHRIYLFGNAPSVIYSDMNGYGPFIAPVRWFQLYWGAASVVLLVAASAMWVRGTDASWKIRLRVARARLRGPALATAGVALAVFVATGSWIFYNTDVLNPYRNEFEGEDL